MFSVLIWVSSDNHGDFDNEDGNNSPDDNTYSFLSERWQQSSHPCPEAQQLSQIRLPWSPS